MPIMGLPGHASRQDRGSRRTPAPPAQGSAARGEARPDSDLDLLVDALPGATLLDLGAVQFELEELLGVSVDVLTPGDLPAKFRDQILKEAALV